MLVNTVSGMILKLSFQSPTPPANLKAEIGRAWLASSKLARLAGHSQTAYSAVLQARQWDAPYSYVQSCKLIRANGEPLRALQELDNALKTSGPAVTDLTGDGPNEDIVDRQMQAKVTQNSASSLTATECVYQALLLRARWMREADRFDPNEITAKFHEPMGVVEK